MGRAKTLQYSTLQGSKHLSIHRSVIRTTLGTAMLPIRARIAAQLESVGLCKINYALPGSLIDLPMARADTLDNNGVVRPVLFFHLQPPSPMVLVSPRTHRHARVNGLRLAVRVLILPNNPSASRQPWEFTDCIRPQPRLDDALHPLSATAPPTMSQLISLIHCACHVPMSRGQCWIRSDACPAAPKKVVTPSQRQPCLL
ncbi:hypothetical protein IQ06DRAFT_155681 [Phaeosphaeriaceae sp. SRC1lsM3a]|nr:hypothetical protein IQ06DRAFT_155681 [Stagonospora sp. SRC1lsM3a]